MHFIFTAYWNGLTLKLPSHNAQRSLVNGNLEFNVVSIPIFHTQSKLCLSFYENYIVVRMNVSVESVIKSFFRVKVCGVDKLNRGMTTIYDLFVKFLAKNKINFLLFFNRNIEWHVDLNQCYDQLIIILVPNFCRRDDAILDTCVLSLIRVMMAPRLQASSSPAHNATLTWFRKNGTSWLFDLRYIFRYLHPRAGESCGLMNTMSTKAQQCQVCLWTSNMHQTNSDPNE